MSTITIKVIHSLFKSGKTRIGAEIIFSFIISNASSVYTNGPVFFLVKSVIFTA